MRLLSAFTSCVCVLLLSSCAATMTGGDSASVAENKIPQREIQSFTFISGSPPVSANARRDQSLKIDSDLNAKMVVKNGYNTVLSEKSGTVTQGQFDAVAKKLNASNYIYLKPVKAAAAVKGKQTFIVSSDLGAHRFVNGGGVSFPAPIAEIFAMKGQFLPQ